MKYRLHIAIFSLVLTATLCADASAQYYFGKNKVQFTNFDWMVLSTKRFDIYFYDSERELAQVAAEAAERAYDVLADRFSHHVEERIPLIIYSSPGFFSQTNVVPDLLPENVGGFTEFMKGRVVLPFNGSYAEFQRVLQHELVHVFTYSKLTAVARMHKQLRPANPPLWFIEGLAEFYSRTWSPDADMIVSDLVLSGRLTSIDALEEYSGTYLMYKGGESFFHFISETYGTDYILRLFENWWRGSDFEEIARATFDKPLHEVGVAWGYWLKKKYFPTIQHAELPDRLAQRVTDFGYNVKAVPFRLNVDGRQEDRIVFKGNRLGYAGLYMTDGPGPKQRFETLLKGERSPQFESLHLLGSSLDVAADGRVLFASKRQERDVLYVLDPAQKRVIAEYRMDSLYVVSSPGFSPDGSQAVLSGCGMDGIHDLYVFEFATRKLRRLTKDLYYDADPVFTPDGTAILFSSDRGRTGQQGYMNLYTYRLSDGAITQVTEGSFNDRNAAYGPDSTSIVFTSDRDGRFNIYRRDKTGRIDRLTNIATGAFDPRYMPDGKGIVFTGFQNSSFQIFKMAIPETTVVMAAAAVPDSAARPVWAPVKASGELARGAVRYRDRFSFDIAQSAVSFDGLYGTVGGFQTALTDVLGNHQYYFLLSNNAETKDDFFKSFSVAATYINQEHRLNYGYGVFHLFDRYVDPLEGDLSERLYGGVGYLGYPLSKFRRIEASLFLRQSEREVLALGETRKAILATNFVSFVHDNSLWDISGPIDGERFMISAGYTADLSRFRSFNRLFVVDARKYFRLGRYSAFATRLMGHFSAGHEPQRRYLGGSWDLRGYPRRGEYARNVILVSNELRFPFIDALIVGSPITSIGLQAIRGAVFFDAGNAWEKDFGRMQGSMGVGARLALGYLIVLRFDWSRQTDFIKIAPRTNFEFFFGWNF
ncbi:MAG: PD40 domain-containing protein [candidate division Zixibacteria bacterium]|nr:PD40 domain-containing protein [candidate division Zixibacteria bacterium]